jgi:hypothetical protein
MEKQKIFFSYARANSEFVLELAKDLRAAGANLWLDQLDIAPGERWDQSIQESLEKCETVLVILSPESVDSQNVMDEVSFALEGGKQVLPVLHKSCEIPFRLRRLQHIDFVDDYGAGFTRLRNALKIEHVAGLVAEHKKREKRTYHEEQKPAALSPISTKGGFNIGSVGGNVAFSAGADMVAGDKITETTTTINNGFKQEGDKQQFLQQIDDLRATLRELQREMQAASGLSEDVKDEIAADVLQQLGALKKVKEEAAGLPVAQQPPPGKVKAIETTLQRTCTVLDKVKEVCDRTVGIAEKVAPYVGKALPIVLSARHLFGLP